MEIRPLSINSLQLEDGLGEVDKRTETDRNDKFRRTMASNLLVGGTFGRASRSYVLTAGGNFGKRVSSSLIGGGRIGKRIPSSLLAGGDFGKRSIKDQMKEMASLLSANDALAQRNMWNLENKNESFDGQPLQAAINDESFSENAQKMNEFDGLVNQYRNPNPETKENI